MRGSVKANVGKGFNKAALAPKTAKPTTTPKSVTMSFRVYPDERDEIRALAGSQTMGEYLRERALQRKSRRKRRVKAVKPSYEIAAKILSALGQSGALANLEKIAVAAEAGALPMTEELETEIRNACALIIAIRHDLITALGIKPQN